MPTLTPDDLLTTELAPYYANPLGFVMMAYPWGQPGTELEHEKGPDSQKLHQIQQSWQFDGNLIQE